MERLGFFCYNSWLNAMEQYGDAEKGRIFTALLQYSMTGVSPQLSGNERFILPMMIDQIDRDSIRRDEFSKKQRDNVNKRYQKEESGIPNLPNPTKPTKDKYKNKYKNNTPYTPQGVEDGFARFWSAYPKKVGKKKAQEIFAKLSPEESTLQAMLASLDYQKQSDQWQRDGGQYIPNPATWLNQRRWEDEDAQPPAQPKKRRPVFDRQYTLEERLNGANPVVVGWEEVE